MHNYLIMNYMYSILFVLIMCMQNAFSAALAPLTTQQSHAQLQQKSRMATDILLHMLQVMVEKHVLGIAGLERLAESPNIINPILPEQYHTSDLVDTFKTQLDTLLEKGKDWFDLARIKAWAQAKIQELENREHTRQRVHEETREVHIPMRFVEIPAGKYEDLITHEEFEIQPGAEIQETPVTQLQWAQIMGENPSHFVDGNDAEEVSVGGKKIKMRPDAPVENVSYNQVQEFITKLNEHDKNNTNYIYALPSVQEYQVLMQSALGSNWLERVQRMRTCSDPEKTCTVTSGDYLLTRGKQRVFGLVGHVWQWTRDMVDLGKYEGRDVNAHLVFGGSRAVQKKVVAPPFSAFLRPIFCDISKSGYVGLRLLRHKEQDTCGKTLIIYHQCRLAWKEQDVLQDKSWSWSDVIKIPLWNYEDIEFMAKHKAWYSRETQHTVEMLLQEAHGKKNLIDYLRGQTILSLSNRQIKDLSPLATLTNLETLYLYENQIQDLSSLATLTRLTALHFENNQIKDVSPLANLSKLDTLDLRANQVEDVSPLASLTKLTWLNLSNNRIGDVSPLANLTKLNELLLMGNPVQDFSPLSQLKNLQLLIDRTQLDQLGANAKSILPYAYIEIW